MELDLNGQIRHLEETQSELKRALELPNRINSVVADIEGMMHHLARLKHNLKHSADKIEGNTDAKSKKALPTPVKYQAELNGKLKPEVVQRAKKLRYQGWTLNKIAAKLGVSCSSVSRYINRDD